MLGGSSLGGVVLGGSQRPEPSGALDVVALETARTVAFLTVGDTGAAFERPRKRAALEGPRTKATFERPAVLAAAESPGGTSAAFEKPSVSLAFEQADALVFY